MSDDALPPTDPAPAPAPAPEAPPQKIAGVPIDVFVKGGTTTAAWDNEQKFLAAQSDHLREHQRQQRQIVEEAHTEGGAISDIFTLQLASAGNPKIVVTFKYNDSSRDRECLAELAFVPMPDDPSARDLVLILVCPYCLRRTGRQDQSQLMIRQSVRMFSVWSSKAPDYPEDKKHWVNHVDNSFHHIAGLVTTHDAVKCDALGCTWRFRIDDSILKEC